MKRGLRSEAGQMTIEAILIMIILTGIAISFTRFMQGGQMVAQIVEGPWLPIRGMIENGVWQSGDKGKALHPTMKARHSSNKGDAVPQQ